MLKNNIHSSISFSLLQQLSQSRFIFQQAPSNTPPHAAPESTSEKKPAKPKPDIDLSKLVEKKLGGANRKLEIAVNFKLAGDQLNFLRTKLEEIKRWDNFEHNIDGPDNPGEDLHSLYGNESFFTNNLFTQPIFNLENDADKLNKLGADTSALKQEMNDLVEQFPDSIATLVGILSNKIKSGKFKSDHEKYFVDNEVRSLYKICHDPKKKIPLFESYKEQSEGLMQVVKKEDVEEKFKELKEYVPGDHFSRLRLDKLINEAEYHLSYARKIGVTGLDGYEAKLKEKIQSVVNQVIDAYLKPAHELINKKYEPGSGSAIYNSSEFYSLSRSKRENAEDVVKFGKNYGVDVKKYEDQIKDVNKALALKSLTALENDFDAMRNGELNDSDSNIMKALPGAVYWAKRMKCDSREVMAIEARLATKIRALKPR